ncbi:nucleotidyltransferase domain-containing protein [Candidatus Hodarchaeum mangrovi]
MLKEGVIIPNILDSLAIKAMEEDFSQLRDIARTDSNIIGLILGGSRGKGKETENSDYDCWIIIKEEVYDEYKEKLNNFSPYIDLGITTLKKLRGYAEWGSSLFWDRYNFAHITPMIDKTEGQLQQIIEEKGLLPSEFEYEFTSSNLDAYINSVYRSIKCLRDGNDIGYRLDAAESISYMLTVLFALHGRIKPYSKYLYWELESFPLTELPWTPQEFINMIVRILDSGDYCIQQKILHYVKQISQAKGYGKIFEEWEGEDQWAMNFKP